MVAFSTIMVTFLIHSVQWVRSIACFKYSSKSAFPVLSFKSTPMIQSSFNDSCSGLGGGVISTTCQLPLPNNSYGSVDRSLRIHQNSERRRATVGWNVLHRHVGGSGGNMATYLSFLPPTFTISHYSEAFNHQVYPPQLFLYALTLPIFFKRKLLLN